MVSFLAFVGGSNQNLGAWAREKSAGLVALGIALAVLIGHATHFDFVNDDAFISFRYADNLVRHGELTFNPGERVEGYTNFLWTIVIAGVLALSGDAVWWSKVLGVVFSCGTLLALFLFSARWTAQPGPKRSSLWLAVAPLMLAMNPAFACWTQGGLETAMFTFLMTCGVLRFIEETRDPSIRPLSGVWIAFAAMTRPEGVLVMGLLGIYRVVWRAVHERTFFPDRYLLMWCAGFLAIYTPYWVWRYVYYGYIFPNTYYAKSGEALWGIGARYTLGFVRDCLVWVTLPLLAFPWRREGSRPLVSAALWIALVYGVHVTRVGGDFMALYRFLVPLLPLFALLVQEGSANVWTLSRDTWEKHQESPMSRGLRIRAALVAFLLISALAVHNGRITQKSLEIGSTDGVDSIGWLKMFVEQTTAVGLHLRNSHPPDTSIATTAAGVIPYYSRMRTLDLLALNDVYTAHNVEAHRRRPGHAKAAPEPYVLTWSPDLLIWHPRLSDRVPKPRAGEARYWGTRGYTFRYAKVPNLKPPYWAFFEKKSSPSQK